MSSWHHDLLDPAQAGFIESRLGDPMLVEDLSWGIVDTRVLHVRAGSDEFVVKTAGPGNHHIGREIAAHERWTAALVQLDRTARFVAGDRERNVLITEYQPGRLVEGGELELSPDIHRQAGETLRAFHDQHERVDPEYEARATRKALAALDGEHRIAPEIAEEARGILAGYRPRPARVVPTHGDWHPRNWLQDAGRLRAIDFGRFDFRPALTDLCRLATQQWLDAPALEAAFLEGYGADPLDAEVWPIELLREAVGTATWAYRVGDFAFETHGHRLLGAALARC